MEIRDREHKIALFANDLAIYISPLVDSLKVLHDTWCDFSLISVLKINNSKSDLYLITLTETGCQLITIVHINGSGLISTIWEYKSPLAE